MSEGRPPLYNSSSEAGALPSEVRIENDSDRKLLSPKFKKIFPRNNISLCFIISRNFFSKLVKMKILITKSTKIVQLVLRKLVKNENFDPLCLYSQCNKGQARAQNFFSPISINLVPKVASNCE